MILVLGTIRLPLENVEAARPAMTRMIEASRAEMGCQTYTYAEDLLDPGLFHVKELWVDRDALRRHFTSPHIAAWRAAGRDLGVGERRLRVYEIDAGEPL